MPLAAEPPRDAPVDLAAMLDRREARAARQRELCARFGRPVVSLTLVTPGPVKDTAEARWVFAEGRAAIGDRLARHAIGVLADEAECLPTGPEALAVVDADAVTVKRALAALEDDHPLGRLWDADVVDGERGSLTRAELGLPARRCLVCMEPAHACARSRRHPLAELQRAIASRIDAYRSRAAR
jgi:holo-ACP synthase